MAVIRRLVAAPGNARHNDKTGMEVFRYGKTLSYGDDDRLLRTLAGDVKVDDNTLHRTSGKFLDQRTAETGF